MKGLYSWQRPRRPVKEPRDTTVNKRGRRPDELHALTLKECEEAVTPCHLNDGGGLSLIVRLGGAKNDGEGIVKQWRLRYTFQGRTTMMGLGGYHKVDLYKARSLADAYRAQAELGIDPAATKKRIRRSGRQPINANLSEACYEILCQSWGDQYVKECFGELHQFDPDGIIGAKLLAVVSGQ